MRSSTPCASVPPSSWLSPTTRIRSFASLTIWHPISSRGSQACLVAVSARDFARLAPYRRPPGVLALARRPPVDPDQLLGRPADAPLILLENPGDLGNIGAVVRVAAAAGAAAVLTTGRHDPWHPAALRGSAGLHFALPVAALPCCRPPRLV